MDFEIALENLAEASDESRQQILDAARSLYIEFGLRRTTMDDIAKRVGIGRATLYRRFSDKDQVFQAVILRDMQRELQQIQAAILENKNYLNGLLDAFVLAVMLINKNPLLSRLLETEPEDVLPFLTTRFDNVIVLVGKFLASRIKDGQKAGHIKRLPADSLAEMILRLTQSLMLTPQGKINAGDESSLRNYANKILKPMLAV